MSNPGGGGYYKYHCRCFYVHNCPQMVYVNNSMCANCVLEHDAAESIPQEAPWNLSREISVPRVEHGVLGYTLMEVAITGDANQKFPAAQVSTTSAVHDAPVITRGD
ncbi:hypothetical protein PG999_002166 [Apiospora kogelbergensis]|uniref:Uncharacterized protein n=1 Tax=Apiospora kogelbergensis TaxID=1337665 RepID=A0AAW0R7M2_9PEZI